jgi:hypothetical protein
MRREITFRLYPEIDTIQKSRWVRAVNEGDTARELGEVAFLQEKGRTSGRPKSSVDGPLGVERQNYSWFLTVLLQAPALVRIMSAGHIQFCGAARQPGVVKVYFGRSVRPAMS